MGLAFSPFFGLGWRNNVPGILLTCLTIWLLKNSLLWLKSDESQGQEGSGKTKAMPPAARCATSKAGCECAFPFVPQGKSHSLLILIGLNLFFKACLSNFLKV